jgi:ribulose 1,5-bisphosphate synthetase/thiazole synthase
MLRVLRVIQIKVRFVPAPNFSTIMSTAESITRPASSSSKTYAPKDLPVYDYDLVVIGGGSGGLAAAKEAAKLNKNAKVI